MSVHSQDSDNEELEAIGGNKPISRQTSAFSRPSSVAIMESLAKTLTEQTQHQSVRMQQQSEQMQQEENRLIQGRPSPLRP